jgi:hypothetical protein
VTARAGYSVSVTGYRITLRHLIELIGTVKLIELKVRDVDFALGKLANRLAPVPGTARRGGDHVVEQVGGVRLNG